MPIILLVEDDKLNSDTLSRRLSRKGFDLECACDDYDTKQVNFKRLVGKINNPLKH